MNTNMPTDSVLRRHHLAQPMNAAASNAADYVGDPKVMMKLENVYLAFKKVKAIENISFEVMRGEVCALIGPNGAGKSSMLNIINGVYVPQAGKITYNGKVYEKLKPRMVAKAGIARTFQSITLFQGMTTLENIMTGRNLSMKSTFWEQSLYYGRPSHEEKIHRERVEEIIQFLQIESIRKTHVSKLPYGLQKRVELGRALAAEPQLLLMDEPMAGMNLEEKQDMSCFIMEINREFGITIILIEHDMGVVMDISDHIIVMDYGVKIGDGTPQEIRDDKRVIEAYLGSSD